MSHSEATHRKSLCAAAQKHWLCWGNCIAAQPVGSWALLLYGLHSCVTSLQPVPPLGLHLERNKRHIPTPCPNPMCSEVNQVANKAMSFWSLMGQGKAVPTLLTWGSRPLFQHFPLSGRSKQMTNEKQVVVVSNWQGYAQDIYIELSALCKSKQTKPPVLSFLQWWVLAVNWKAVRGEVLLIWILEHCIC